MVFPMLLLEEELIGRYGVVRSILADLHFDDCITVRAKKRATAFVPPDGRIAHTLKTGCISVRWSAHNEVENHRRHAALNVFIY